MLHAIFSKEFHGMPEDEKINDTKDPNGRCKLYTNSGRATKDVVEYWKDGEWIAVEPIPNAFVETLCYR